VTEDEKVFGIGQWVYCGQHLRPHRTGWCTVGVRDKVGLGTTDETEAWEKCSRLGLRLYKDVMKEAP
jgi:hypothetical protein